MDTSRHSNKRKLTRSKSALKRARSILGGGGSINLGYLAGSRGGSLGYGRRELKFIDTQVLNNAITTAGTLTLLNGLVQGTDFNQRIGRKIIMTSILTNWTLYPNFSSQSATGDEVRLMLIYDSQPSGGAAPSVTDVLAAADVNSPMNLNNRDRFRIIMDKRYCLAGFQETAGNLTAGSPYTVRCNQYKKITKEVIFGGTGGTLAAITTGSVYLLTISHVNIATVQDSYHRIRFWDS